jgi:hypothetical protein
MPALTTPLRPFWIPGLNTVTGHVEKGLSGWFSDSEFQIYSQIQTDSFIAHISIEEPLLAAFAADINRCALAALESIHQVQPVNSFPKSVGWLVIKSYYAAFFAAHCLLRTFGIAFAQIDRRQAGSITQIASLFGMSNGISVNAGYYKCTYAASTNTLKCEKVNTSAGGVHEVFWSVVYKQIKIIIETLLISKIGLEKDNQAAAAKLMELTDNLSYASFASGSWLSHVRNIVNYNQRLGVWFPYSGQLAYTKKLLSNDKTWLQDTMTINLVSHGDQDLLRFQQTCNFLVGLCRETSLDMAARCPTGKSFHLFGSMAFLNLMKQRSSKSK